jgi:phosphatidylserine decarboxylase
MRDAFVVSVLSILPRNRLAWLMGWCARTGLSALATRAFVAIYGVNISEAEHPLSAYPTLNALFTRRLRAGVRPIDDTADAIVSPVDGTVAFVGATQNGVFEVAPGRTLSVAELLGEPVEGEREVMVLYLSPTDYHRVHNPREGVVLSRRYVAGTLWPVFPGAVARVDGLFARNERMVVDVQTSEGPLHVALIGAFGVGRIGLAFDPCLSNDGAPASHHRYEPPIPLARGADLGVFHLGSTVILVGRLGMWSTSAKIGDKPRIGEHLAQLANNRVSS